MPAHQKGKKGRKIGRGIDKIKRSKWMTYSNVISHSQERKRQRIAARRCPECKQVIHSRGALKRHILRATCGEQQAAA